VHLHLGTKIYFFKKSLAYLKNYKRLGFLIIVASLLSSIFDGFSIGAIIPFLENLSTSHPTETTSLSFLSSWGNSLLGATKEQALLRLLSFALIMVMFRSITNYIRLIALSKTQNLIHRDLETNFFRAVAGSSLRFFHTVRSGQLVANFSVFTNSIVAFIFVLLNLIGNISKIIVYLVLLFFISWRFTLLAITLEITFFPFFRFLLNRIKILAHHIANEVGSLHSRLIETLESIPLIKISSTENQETNRFNDLTTKIAFLEYRQSKQTSLIPFVTEIAVMGSLLFLFSISVKVFHVSIIDYLPFIITYLYVFLRLFNETNIFLSSVSGMFEHAPAFKSYENYLNQAKKMTLPDGHKHITNLKQNIVFQDITFGYAPDHQILKHINLTFSKGSFTAIVGPTGAGKTTIVNLITGLFIPNSGKILIDANDLQTLKGNDWRRLIGFISQEPIIFNDTIWNNIAYGVSNTTNQAIIQAAKIADIDKFISNLPEGYNTLLGERGSRLSGGQKQRIAIARALARNPEIIILDEATSAVDSKTEENIRLALEKAFYGRTVIAIAHRLSTILKADNIVVIDRGHVIEQGSHADLINLNGHYKKYYDLQFKN